VSWACKLRRVAPIRIFAFFSLLKYTTFIWDFFISIGWFGVSIIFLCFWVDLANFVGLIPYVSLFYSLLGYSIHFFGGTQESPYKIVNRKSSCGYATHFLIIIIHWLKLKASWDSQKSRCRRPESKFESTSSISITYPSYLLIWIQAFSGLKVVHVKNLDSKLKISIRLPYKRVGFV
jgi:hypothetical protein